jgi:hypothetical protein
MEYLDGEGTASSRAAIGAHLATCAACQAFAAEQRGLSSELGAWQVKSAPETLRVPQPAPSRPRWRVPAWVMWPRASVVTFSAVAGVVVLLAIGTSTPKRMAAPNAGAPVAPNAHAIAMPEGATDSLVSAAPNGPRKTARVAGEVGGGLPVAKPVAAPKPAPESSPSTPPTVRALIRTATLQIVANDFAGVRAAVEGIVADANGFADQMSMSADPGAARVLRATLRVPGDRLNAALDRLRALGQVTADQQGAEDVSDQIVDLDARLKNARATEQRLTDILRERTGKLSDVLEVEQEVARVRLEIEQLDAQKTNMTRRVAYAAITVTISEERKAGLDSGPLSLLTQIRVASADGLQNVVDTLVGVMLFALRAGPTLILWGLAVVIGWMALKRARRHFHSA